MLYINPQSRICRPTKLDCQNLEPQPGGSNQSLLTDCMKFTAASEGVSPGHYQLFSDKLGTDSFMEVSPYSFKKSGNFKLWVRDNDPPQNLGFFQLGNLMHTWCGPGYIVKYDDACQMKSMTKREMKNLSNSIEWRSMPSAIKGEWTTNYSTDGNTLVVSTADRLYQCRCGAVSYTKRCSRCGITRYCSTECQRKDWPVHKLKCVKRPPKCD